MNPISTLHRSLVGLLICLVMAVAPAWAGDDFVRWTNPSGGSWNQPGNWNPERVPGPSDVVLFEVDAEFTVHFESQPYFTTLYVRAGQVTLELGDYGLISAFSEDDRRRVECSSTDAETKLIIRDGYPFDPFIQTWLQECIVQAGGGQFGDHGTIVFFDHRYPVQVAGVDNWHLYVASKLGVLKVASGELGWEFGFASDSISSHFLATQGGTIQVDGKIRGSNFFGEGGNLIVNGSLGVFADELALGDAVFTTSSTIESEDIRPGNMLLLEPCDLVAQYVDAGVIRSALGGSFLSRYGGYFKPSLEIGVWQDGCGHWGGTVLSFESPVSVFVPDSLAPPSPPSSHLLASVGPDEDLFFDLSKIVSGTIDPSIPGRTKVVVISEIDCPTAWPDRDCLQVWLRVAPDDWCIADQNFDRQVNFFDVAEFLRHYNERLPWAELNGDGLINFFDVEAFLTVYLRGCQGG